jgi:hypothetical protein
VAVGNLRSAPDEETSVTNPLKQLTLTLTSCVLLLPSVALAQPIGARLSTLLTEQRAVPGAPAPDPAAAAVTFSTVAGLFGVELTTLPLASSSGGFVYHLNPTLGLVERASESFGPFFTERAQRNGRGQASFGISYQASNFASLQGADLTDGTFPTNAIRVEGSTTTVVDQLTLDLEARTTTPFGSYGVTDRLDVGVALPIVSLRFSGSRVATSGSQSVLQSSQSGSATGLGDMAVTARFRLTGDGGRGLAIGADVRLPTGRAEDLLGSGDATVRGLAIGSWEEGQLALHANAGAGGGGASNEVFWGGAMTFAASPRITLVSEVTGRWLSDLSVLQDVYQPHSIVDGAETMRWLPVETGVHTAFFVGGAKWNIAGTLLANVSLLVRLTDTGLRARVTPSISLDYAFGR